LLLHINCIVLQKHQWQKLATFATVAFARIH
jgi:hypothetical protein